MKSVWLREFMKPLNIVSLLIAALSLAFAIISSAKTGAPRRISYVITTTHLVSYTAASTDVGLFDSAGRAIEGDVYVATVIIWNSGSSAVAMSDMYRPLRYELFDRGRFISVNKLVELEPSITNMRGNIDSDNSISFEWDNLDLGMGARYQIAYISLDREQKSNLLDAISAMVFRRGFSTDLTGFIREGELVDVHSAPRSVLGAGLFLFASGVVVLFVISITRMILSKPRFARAHVVLDKALMYAFVPLSIGVLMLLAATIFIGVIARGPSGLT